MKAKERHHHRPESQARAFGCRFQQGNALFSLLLREFDDEDAIFRGETNQHDHADLCMLAPLLRVGL